MSWGKARTRIRAWLRSKAGRTQLERIEKNILEHRELLHALRKQMLLQAHPTSAEEFHLDSRDLDYIYREEEPSFTSSILIEGEVSSSLGEVRVTLFVDHEPVASEVLGSSGSFRLQHVPKHAGKVFVRVIFDSRGRTLRDIGPIGVVFEPVGDLEHHEATLHRLMSKFQLAGRLGFGGTEHLIHLLMKRNREAGSSFSKMLSSIDAVLENAPHSNGTLSTAKEASHRPAQLPAAPAKPLRILLASWNVPCLRHGGGLWLTNLLKQLSKRHAITVVYCYSPHEEGWIEDIRPYAQRLIGVKKSYSAPPDHEDQRIIDYMYREYVAELREVIDQELRTGNYDLVDYEYTWMLPYVSAAEVPRVLTIVEEPFTAYVANYTYEKASDEDKVGRLDRLLRMFYLCTVALPRKFRNLITVTAQDAELVTRFSHGTTVHTNGIGIETERFALPAGTPRPTSERPKFVILGNFQHPPNIDAALFVCEKVFPLLKQRFPDAELYVLGPFPNAALQEAGKREGIHVAGFVDDYRPHFWSATAFVAPIFTGSGMRVKVLEAMASGTPVITTTLGIRGIAARNGEEYFHAETASDFVAAAAKCVESPAIAGAVGQKGRLLIERDHSSEAMALERERIWQATIDSAIVKRS